MVERTHTPPAEPHYAVRHLARWSLGTSYPAIVADVAAMLNRAPMSQRATPLVVDAAGVGRAVADLFIVGGIEPYAVTLTAGSETNRVDGRTFRVPKREVASTLVALFQSGRLKIVESLELRPALINELASFKLKINIATGNDGSPSVLVHSARQHEEDAGEADPAWHVHTSVASGFSTCSRTPRLGPGSRAN